MLDDDAPDWCEIYRGVKGLVEGKWLVYPGTHSCLPEKEAARVVAKIKPFLDLIAPVSPDAVLAGIWERWAFTKEEWEQLLEGMGEIYDPDQPLE